MADQTPLRINCTNCPGNQGCDDCLVHFFVAERAAEVVSLDRKGAARPQPATTPAELPADLADAFAALAAAGLGPELLSVESHDVESHDAARAS